MNSTNNHNHYGHSNKQNTTSNKHYPSNYHQKGEHSIPSETIVHPSPIPIVPSQPGYRMPAPPHTSISSSNSVSSPSSLLVVSSTKPTPTNATAAGEYNPFASNILTTSIVGVLTKTKEPVASTDESNSSSTTKMNFANVAKMNVQSKSSHHEPIVITMDEPLSPPRPNPKIAPGYRGPSSAGTTPIQQQQMIRTSNYESHSPTSQLSLAPGANRHQQSVSPSMNKVLIDQNGQTGSSTASSTSSSPSSIKQQSNQYIQPPQFHAPLDQQQQQQQQPFGAIGSQRTQIPATADVTYSDNPMQMRANFNRALSANNTPIYQQGPPQPSPMMLNNPAYANLSRSRSNLNPSAPEFQHGNHLPPPPFMPTPPSLPQMPNSNGPLSANIMNIARMMEQKQQQQLYTNNNNVPVHPSQPQPTPPPPPPSAVVPPPVRPIQQTEMGAMQQHVQNQVLHYYRLQTNQQQLVPPPPQLPTTLQIASILAKNGQLPPDPNQAAALVAAYYYTNVISRTQQQTPTNNIPLSSNVNKNVYETISTQPQTTSNSDDPSLTTGKQI